MKNLCGYLKKNCLNTLQKSDSGVIKIEHEVFERTRDFYKKFPSRFYICSNCGYMNNSKYTCQKCGWRTDGLFQTMGKGYKYTIKSTGITEEIFKPIELEKGKTNVRRSNEL